MFVKIISFYKICTKNVKKTHHFGVQYHKTASPHHPKNGDEGTYIYKV